MQIFVKTRDPCQVASPSTSLSDTQLMGMGLTLLDKTSCLANRSDPPASLPSTRIELLCWAFYSGTGDLSSGL